MTASQPLLFGVRQALGRLWPVAALFGVGAGETFLALGAFRAVPLFIEDGSTVALWAGIGAVAAAWLSLQLLRSVFLYRALGPASGTWGRAVVRGLGYFALSAALSAMLRLWWWTGLIASGRAYLSAVGDGPAAASSFALATVMAGGALFSLFFAGLAELALARSASNEEPYSLSLAWAAGALVQRPWVYVWIVALTGSLRWGAEVGLKGLAQAAGPSAMLEAPALSLGAAIAGGLAASLASAVVELTRLYALQAAQGAPAPQPQPILSATLVDAPGGGD